DLGGHSRAISRPNSKHDPFLDRHGFSRRWLARQWPGPAGRLAFDVHWRLDAVPIKRFGSNRFAGSSRLCSVVGTLQRRLSRRPLGRPHRCRIHFLWTWCPGPPELIGTITAKDAEERGEDDLLPLLLCVSPRP